MKSKTNERQKMENWETIGQGFGRRQVNCYNNNYFGLVLKEVRKEKNLSQIDAAKLLNVTQSQWSAYEIGKIKPTLELIRKIAEAVDYDCLDLIERALDKAKYFVDNPVFNKEQLASEVVKITEQKVVKRSAADVFSN